MVCQEILCSTFVNQLRDKTRTSYMWQKKITGTQHTHAHKHLLFTNTDRYETPPPPPTAPSSVPSWQFPCSDLTENKAGLWLGFNLWPFLQFLTLNCWPTRERRKKIAEKGSDPTSQWRFNSFLIFSSPLEQWHPLKKAHIPECGCDDTIFCVRVCVHAWLLWTPFRLLSPHQPTHTWLTPLGPSLRISVFIAPHAYVPSDLSLCVCVVCVWGDKEKGRKEKDRGH